MGDAPAAGNVVYRVLSELESHVHDWDDSGPKRESELMAENAERRGEGRGVRRSDERQGPMSFKARYSLWMVHLLNSLRFLARGSILNS